MKKKILCVILHYGPESDTWNCVSTLADDPDIEIVISDNDPTQSLEIAPKFKGRVKIIRTGGQAGFAEGNNLAVKSYLKNSHDYILFLNNDTLAQKGALDQMRTTLSERDIGAVGPCMPFAQNPYKMWACGGRISKWRLKISGLKECIAGDSFDVDYLPGAAILCKSIVWKKVNGLPEKYFLAYEEAEFAIEVQKAGYRVVVEPKAHIFHKVGMSGQNKPMYKYNSVRNRIKFGQYLWGIRLGFFLGVIVTLDVVVNRNVKTYGDLSLAIRLWWLAVSDEMKGKPLDRNRILTVGEIYGGAR